MLFRREGEYWTVAFAGKLVRMRDAKGLGYLARLLRHPHREFHVLDLLVGDAPRAEAAARDGRSRSSRRRTPESCWTSPPSMPTGERIAELEAEIEEAQRWNDPERTARAEDELDALTRELAERVGLGGRDRRAASDSERARVSVTKAVRSAVRRLEDQHPELGRHLSAGRAHRDVLRVRPRPDVAGQLGRLTSRP